MKQTHSYNLPGYGLIKYRLFPYTERVYRFLDKFGHIRRLRETDQLGALRGVFPGAHHNRFEYVIAQLAIITELCKLKGPQPEGITLSSNNQAFGRLPGVSDWPTQGEVLQILVLLSNSGHLPSTFAGERALLSYLRNHERLRRTFRRGLPAKDRSGFDTVCSHYDLYQFHYYIAMFLLGRYRRPRNGAETVRFCQSILRAYLSARRSRADGPPPPEWTLYRNIRRLAYVSLDSLYTPVPFSLELAAIFLSLEENLIAVFRRESEFQEALIQLEGVLKDTVYLSPSGLFQIASVARNTLSRLGEFDKQVDTVTRLRHLLEPFAARRKGPQCFRAALKETPFEEVRYPLSVALNYECDPALAHSVLGQSDPVRWEQRARSRVGIGQTRFGCEWDPTHSHLRVAAALAQMPETAVELWRAFRIAKQLADLDISARGRIGQAAQGRWANGRAVIEFLVRAVFGSSRRYRFKTLPVRQHSPVFMDYGSTKVAGKVKEYMRDVEDDIGADELNEISMLARTLREIRYRGLLVAFAGSTELLSDRRSLAEFDGLVLLLGWSDAVGPLIVVEAKNQSHGHTAARKQLREQLEVLGADLGHCEITELPTRGAFASLSLAGAPALTD